MGIISGGNVVDGSGLGSPLQHAGAPVDGTDEVQTLTIGGTPTGGTFSLEFAGHRTTLIDWTATDATLVSDIEDALESLASIGTGNVAVAAGTLSSGVGTITLTFQSGMGKLAVSTITVGENNLTGTTPTLAVAETTPGVTATHRSAPTGAPLIDTTNGILYQNTGAPGAPTWSKVGLES